MNGDAMASYRAAGAFGDDRDDDEPSGPGGPPTWYAAVWYAPMTWFDREYGFDVTQDVQCSRLFSLASHAKPYEAARRWAGVMAKRHGVAWVREGWDGGESFETKVGPFPST